MLKEEELDNLVGKPELYREENRNGWEFIRKADWCVTRWNY
jgi:hypothetical protein